MYHFAIGEITRAFLSATDGRGIILMLESYFDDSGTHSGSRVVVWGGLIGDAQSFVELDAAWRAQLDEPVPGKPPIKAFHLYDCVHGLKECDRYEQGARDLARNLFRTIIMKSGVAAVACGVDAEEWDRQVTGDLRTLVGSAERCAFGQCVKLSMQIANRENEAMQAFFDAERERVVLGMVDGARLLFPEVEKMIITSFAPVVSLTGLQAADTVAYESYGLLRAYLDDPNAKPEPHLRHMVANAESTTVMLMGRDQIAALVEKMQPTVEEYQRNGSLGS